MPQIVPFVVTAITAVTSAVVAAGPLAVAAFNAANIIGAAALANEAFKAVQPEVKSSNTALEWNADPNAPNRFAFGRVGGAGNIIHNATYGPDKMFVGFVGVMSASGPIKSWQAFKADDAFVSFNAAGMAINTEYAGEMYLGRQRGLQPEPSYLPSPSGLKHGAAMPRWGASYKLSGKAAYMYTLAENSKRSAFRGKVPTGIHYIEGLYCYDPRFDSTYPGGTGPCRIDDPTTWVYSTNAYIHALNWNIGRWEGEARGITPKRYGVPYASMKVGGIGATPEGIDFSGYVEAANVFDENAWACSAWPDADQSKAAVLDSFLQAGGGIYAERQGKISCLHRAAPRTSIVTITADDTAGTIEYDTTTSLLERINTIRPEYWSEAHGWQMVATDEVTSDVWREEDGQGVAVTRSKGLAYNYVPQSKQARELSALQIAHTREGIRGTAPLRHYLDLEVGDCFTFEVPEAVLNGQKCIVLNVDPDLENDIINVTFASESDGKYAFAFGQADAPPPAPALQPADNTVSPPLPGDWTITPRPPAPGGGQLPGFDLGGIVSNETATAIIVEYGPTETGPWKQAYQGPPTVTTIPIDGLQPGANYYIAVQYQRNQNYSERYVYGPYTAPLLDPSPTAPTIVSIRNDIEAAFGDIFDVSELLADARTQLDAQGAEIAAARNGEANLAARISGVNQARIDGDEANATAISGVAARTANTEADIIDLENALANETAARAEAVSQLTARSTHRPNLIDNPSGAADFRAWIKEGSPASYVDDDRLAGRIFVVYGYMVSQVYPAAAGDQHSLGFVASPLGDGGHVRLQYVTPGGFVDAAPVPSGAGGYDVRRRSTAPSTAPAGATGFRVVVVPPSGGVLPVWAIKVNFGSVATDFSDDYSGTVLAATVTEQSLAIIDLENQQAIASWRIKSEASGSKPAIIEAVSALGGSYVAFGAEQIYFGENTVLDNATDTIQTITGGRIRVTAWGAPFGLYGDLLEWWGPTGIALSSMTPGNGYSGRMTSPPYVFDNVVAGASGSAAARKESFYNSFAMGNTWSTVEVFTPVGVPSSPFVSANIEWQGPPSVSDTSVWNGEMRLVEAATGTVVAAPQAFSITHNNEPFAVALSGAGVSAGAVQYALQARRTSGSNTVTAVGFAINFDAYQRL
ncbi:fibronectin type III domain-containing protein [Brevundimonas diminuta]